jgi:nitroreductase
MEPEPVDVHTALRTNGAVRDFTGEPVDDATIAQLLDTARFAPSGGNRQPWHVAVIRDTDLRRQLADLCQPVWNEYVAQGAAGETPFAVVGATSVDLAAARAEHQPNPLLDRIEQAPAVLVVAADLAHIAMMDKDLDRPTLTGGASVYPFVWSLLLAARGLGLGGVMTTFLARAEDEARALLHLPEGWAIASMVVLGHPTKRATKLRRNPVESFTTVDRFDGPTFGA